MSSNTNNKISIGDEVTVKNIDYGYFTVKQIHPNGIENKKCQLIELQTENYNIETELVLEYIENLFDECITQLEKVHVL